MIVYIYDNKLKYITDLYIYTIEDFEKNPKSYFEEWENGFYISEIRYENPILDNGQVREMTREELILMKNRIELLLDGEYIEAGEIKTIEKPLNLIRPIWNRELHIWNEGMTKEELMLKRKDLIMQYKEIKTEIETLEEFSAEFESDNTIVLLREQMSKIKKEIDDLLVKIKQLA